MKQLPLGDWHRGLGARMVSFAGYEMPVQYEGVMAEHIWTRTEAGLFDVIAYGAGDPDRRGARLKRWRRLRRAIFPLWPLARYAIRCCLHRDGGILDDLMVTNTGRNLYLVVNGATKHDDIAYMQGAIARPCDA